LHTQQLDVQLQQAASREASLHQALESQTAENIGKAAVPAQERAVGELCNATSGLQLGII